MKTRWMIMALLVAAGMTQAAFVTIGNAGNAADTTGYGAVGYTYQISATEVTIAEFMASGAGSGGEDYWNDAPRTVGTSAPAVNVSLYEAMKYCNYLTSGNVNDGVYTFSGGVYQSTMSRTAIMAGGLDAVATDPNKIYALPTEDEWYKAAYYTGSGYSLYADGSGTVPTEGGGATGWNYNYVNSSPNFTRDTALGTTEQNGTVNMMGNVWEWMEDGARRGGGYGSAASSLGSSGRAHDLGPTDEYGDIGFRVVAIPEPATAGLLAGAGLLIAAYRRYFGQV